MLKQVGVEWRLALSTDPPASPSQMLVSQMYVHCHTWSEAAAVKGSEGITYFHRRLANFYFCFPNYPRRTKQKTSFLGRGLFFSMLWLSASLFRDSLLYLIWIGLELVIVLLLAHPILVLQAHCTTLLSFVYSLYISC